MQMMQNMRLTQRVPSDVIAAGFAVAVVDMSPPRVGFYFRQNHQFMPMAIKSFYGILRYCKYSCHFAVRWCSAK
jgi:hypothetical protein